MNDFVSQFLQKALAVSFATKAEDLASTLLVDILLDPNAGAMLVEILPVGDQLALHVHWLLQVLLAGLHCLRGRLLHRLGHGLLEGKVPGLF